MKMPSHVLRLMCHCDCVIIAPGSPQAQCLQALINQSTIDRPLYRECKSTCTQKKNTDRKHKLAKHSGLPSDMKSVQGSKILADVRTDSFHSGPLTDPDPNHRGSLSVSRACVIRTGRDLGREFMSTQESCETRPRGWPGETTHLHTFHMPLGRCRQPSAPCIVFCPAAA